MPMDVAAPVFTSMPISCSASPRVRVSSSPGRASEPTAMIHTTSFETSTLVALSTLVSDMSVGLTLEVGASVAHSATTVPTTSRRAAPHRPRTSPVRALTGSPPRPRRTRRPATHPCPWS